MEDPALVIPVVAMGSVFVIVIVSVVTGMGRRVVETRERERSRREIAAYIAEGTMSPEDGVRLLNAGQAKPEE